MTSIQMRTDRNPKPAAFKAVIAAVVLLALAAPALAKAQHWHPVSQATLDMLCRDYSALHARMMAGALSPQAAQKIMDRELARARFYAPRVRQHGGQHQ